ncbi:MAG: hypothetical protein NTW38_12100 [Candidatus Aminicenantes bacterium]|nr:hypothetical protein [Candidatus Aminicenantes bacterium]
MTLKEIFLIFSERVADIVLYKRAAKATAKKELLQLNQYAEKLKENPAPKESSSSLDAMYYIDPKTGSWEKYGFRESSLEDREKLVVFQKNKQYCWLLAEAYEEFEDYLEATYAHLGYKDISSWIMSDFGNISIADLVGKDYAWYLDRAKNKRDTPQSILTRLRELYPQLVDLEIKNRLDVNLKLAIELIAHLRHYIVHRGGLVTSRDAFLESVLKKCGFWNNGKYHEDYEAFIYRFFGTGEYENVISILEIRIHPEIPLDIQLDPFDELTRYLVGYASLVYDIASGKA